MSGLSANDAQSFIKALETARVAWWRQTLESQIDILRSVHNELAQLADPPAYLQRSAFAELRQEADSAANQFVGHWPDTLSNVPEIQMLRAIQDFLEVSSPLGMYQCL